MQNLSIEISIGVGFGFGEGFEKQGSNMLIIKTGELQNIPHLSFWVPIFAAAKGPFS